MTHVVTSKESTIFSRLFETCQRTEADDVLVEDILQAFVATMNHDQPGIDAEVIKETLRPSMDPEGTGRITRRAYFDFIRSITAEQSVPGR